MLIATLCLHTASYALPYTMLTCAEGNSCSDYCTQRSQARFPASARWGQCPSASDPCDASHIQCSSLEYITIDDVVAQYGPRALATTAEKTGLKAVIVSVQDAAITGGGGSEVQKQLEWLHVLSQGVSNVAHWLGPPEGWQSLRSMEQMTDGNMHLTMDAAIAEPTASYLHVNSWTKNYESSPMPDGGSQIGNLVVQLVDSSLKASILSGAKPFCEALNLLYPNDGSGLADVYDFVFFVVAGGTYYTSTHTNIHQSAISGTGTGATQRTNCGGAFVKGATLLQPLPQAQMGPFFHEWYHQYAAHMSLLHTQLGSDSGGHWGWTAFPDHRGVLGGFNYFYCAAASGGLSTKRFLMESSGDPATECDASRSAGSTAPTFISVDESEATLDSPPASYGLPSGSRWGKLGDSAGRPDYLYKWPFNKFELYVLGLLTVQDLGGGASSTTSAPTASPAVSPTTAPSAPTMQPTNAPLMPGETHTPTVQPSSAPTEAATVTTKVPTSIGGASGGGAAHSSSASAKDSEATTLLVLGIVGSVLLALAILIMVVVMIIVAVVCIPKWMKTGVEGAGGVELQNAKLRGEPPMKTRNSEATGRTSNGWAQYRDSDTGLMCVNSPAFPRSLLWASS